MKEPYYLYLPESSATFSVYSEKEIEDCMRTESVELLTFEEYVSICKVYHPRKKVVKRQN